MISIPYFIRIVVSSIRMIPIFQPLLFIIFFFVKSGISIIILYVYFASVCTPTGPFEYQKGSLVQHLPFWCQKEWSNACLLVSKRADEVFILFLTMQDDEPWIFWRYWLHRLYDNRYTRLIYIAISDIYAPNLGCSL